MSERRRGRRRPAHAATGAADERPGQGARPPADAGNPEPPDGAGHPDDPETLRVAAEEQVRRNADALRTFPLSPAAEPAFVFRP